MRFKLLQAVIAVTLAALPLTAVSASVAQPAFGGQTKAAQTDHLRVKYRSVLIDGVKVFYREAGDPAKPTILLLHGFPTSSHMFRDLIPALASDYHLVAPDYPGFGNSDMPSAETFAYTFDNLTDVVEKFTDTLKLRRYSLYVQDYGAPIGFRLAVRHPERVQAIVTQNGNAYDAGLTPFWKPLQDAYWKSPTDENAKPLLGLLTVEGTRFQYETGVRSKQNISPDAWKVPQAELDRPGNRAIQLALFYDYRTNPPLYSAWHEYLRKHQPPTLVVWGKNDPIFGADGAKAFLKDLPKAELHLLDTGHFALEEDGPAIAQLMRGFLKKNVR